MNLKRQFFFLHIYNFLVSFRVADGVWVVFLLARGFSLAQVGIAEGVFHVVSFLCEVPSGMLADLVGRKRTLALSGLFGMLSALAMAFSQDFFGVCLSMAFQALMYNLCSGTQEALTYDSLKAVGQEGSYLKRNAWLMGASQASASLSSLLGGAAALLGFFPAYLITAACSAVCASAAFALVEPRSPRPSASGRSTPSPNWGPGSGPTCGRAGAFSAAALGRPTRSWPPRRRPRPSTSPSCTCSSICWTAACLSSFWARR